MSTENQEKLKYVDIQLAGTVIFIITVIISFILTYDQKLSLENKKRLFKNNTAQDIALFQTVLIVVVAIIYLYVNYNQYEISKKYHEKDQNDLLLQTGSSILSIITAVVGLYIVITSKNDQLSIAETDIL